MHVYPVKDDNKQLLTKKLNDNKNDISSLNHRERNDLVLLYLEQGYDIATILSIIDKGANVNMAVYSAKNPAIKIGNLLDVSLDLLGEDTSKERFELMRSLLLSGAGFTDKDAATSKINNFIEESRNTVSLRQNFITLENIVNDPTNKRYGEDYDVFIQMNENYPVYPLPVEKKKEIIKLISEGDTSHDNLNKKQKDDYLLLLLEKGDDFAGVFNVIKQGANKDLEFLIDGGLAKPKRAIDYAVELLEEDGMSFERFLIIHGLIKSGAEFKDQDKALKVMDRLINNHKDNPEVTGSLILLENMIKDPKNPRYTEEDYQFFSNKDNFGITTAINKNGELEPNGELEEQNREEFIEKMKSMTMRELFNSTVNDYYGQHAESINEIAMKQNSLRNKVFLESSNQNLDMRIDSNGKIYENGGTGYFAIDLLRNIFNSDPYYVHHNTNKGSDEMRMKFLEVPEWLKDGSLEQEQQIYKDKANDYIPFDNFPLSKTTELWFKMQAVELDTRDGNLKRLFSGRNLTMLSYAAFGMMPLTLPLWGPALVGAVGIMVIPPAMTLLPLIGAAVILTSAPKVLSKVVDNIRLSFVQSRMDSLIKDSLGNGTLNVEEFKKYIENLKNQENYAQRKDLLAHKSHEYRTAELVYRSLTKINKTLPANNKMDLKLDLESRHGFFEKLIKGKGNSKKREPFVPKNSSEIGDVIKNIGAKIEEDKETPSNKRKNKM